MALDRGTIHARIWAPPKLFFVNTQALAVDLGCAYTLQIDEQGATAACDQRLGGARARGRDASCLKAPCARCATMAGPGTPRHEDAPSGYGEALTVLDFSGLDDPRRGAALELVISTARRVMR